MPKKAGRGRGTVKGETLTIRLSPKTKFILDLLARSERRSLSSIVESAIDRELEDKREVLTGLRDGEPGMGQERFYIPDQAWDPLVPDRLVKLAQTAPDLLEYDEQLVWKTIQETPLYWEKEKPLYEIIRRDWEDIQIKAEEAKVKFG